MNAYLSVDALYEQLALPDSPALIDSRDESAFLALPRLIPGAMRGAAESIETWARALPRTRPVAVYCQRGGETSRTLVEALIGQGYPAVVVEGGLEAWLRAGYVTVRARTELDAPGGSRWVTRERPKIDRLACPWLIRRFIDPNASFFYTPAHRVRAEAEVLGAEPYDIADVTFSHRGARCSFDAFLEEFDLHDPVLTVVADIVRAADTGELEQSREAPGLLAISLGLSANQPDDFVLLEQAMPLYDALYAWCKKARGETHSWPRRAIAQ
jgi:rhodanese-related sulfurtransferase